MTTTATTASIEDESSTTRTALINRTNNGEVVGAAIALTADELHENIDIDENDAQLEYEVNENQITIKTL